MPDPEYKHKDVVWCKCGGLFWPGEVRGIDSLPKEIREGFLKTPKVVVKFFDEDGYEFVLNDKDIFPYNCDRKEEFIKKGLARSRRKAKEGATGGWFAKFPKDVVHCEKLTKGNINILEEEPFVEKKEKKIDYSLIFGDPEEISLKKEELIQKSSTRKGRSSDDKESPNEVSTTPKKITHPRFIGRSDHTVRILAQPSTPYHIDTNTKTPSTPMPPKYNCHICDFAATRLNVIVLHNKSHSAPNRTNLGNYERPKISKAPRVPADLKTVGIAKKRSRVSSPKSNSEIVAKRPRLNKRQKEEKKEMVKEREEKKQAIFGDWSEDENEEEEEKVKLKETIENADSMPSSQDTDSDNRMSDDDFFSTTDDHHSIDSDDDFILSNPMKEKNKIPSSIACTKPLRKRKVDFESFTKEQQRVKPKAKPGEKIKAKLVGNKKTESVVDAVNSLIKSKLQPNKTYVSSERSRLNSRAEIVDVLRKTPTKHNDNKSLPPKKKASANDLNVSQILLETKLPEMPSLPKGKNSDVYESNFSSSDSGAQGASSAEEQCSPPVSPPPNTLSKKPGILRKSSTRSIQLPTRPNGDSQLIKHEEGGTKYAVISAKAKAKQLARTQMAKDELLARNQEAATKEQLLTEEIDATPTIKKCVMEDQLQKKVTEDSGKPEKQHMKSLENTRQVAQNGQKQNVDKKCDIVEMKNDEKKDEKDKTGGKDAIVVKMVTGDKHETEKKERIIPKEEHTFKDNKLNKEQKQELPNIGKVSEQKDNMKKQDKSINSKDVLPSEFDFIDDLTNKNEQRLTSPKKSEKTKEETPNIIKDNQMKKADTKILSTPTKDSPNKKLNTILPTISSVKKTELKSSISSNQSPPVTKVEVKNSEKYSALVNKNTTSSQIVQSTSKSTVSSSPSMVIKKPIVNSTVVKPIQNETTVRVIGSTAKSVSLPVVTSPKPVTQKNDSKQVTVSFSSSPTVKVNKPLLSAFNQTPHTLSSNSIMANTKPAVKLISKASPSNIHKPVVIQEKKPMVTIISKPNTISIEKSSLGEMKIVKTQPSNSGLTISKSQIAPAKKPVMASVSKLTIESVSKPAIQIQSKLMDLNKPVVAGFNKLSDPISVKNIGSVGIKHSMPQQALSSPNKPILLQNNKPTISTINKPSLSPLKMGNKVVTLSQKKEPLIIKSPEVKTETKNSIGSTRLLSPTKGAEKPLTVSLETKKVVMPAVERSKPIVKTVELPKRAAEVAAAMKPAASPTKPVVFIENNDKKATLEIELDNSPVSEFIVAVNEPVSEKTAVQSSETMLGINDLTATDTKIAGAGSLVLPAEVGSDSLTAFNLSSGGLQFIGEQALTGTDADGEMPIYLLVDDGTDPNLENQTLYIDPSQLAAATGGMILQNAAGSGPLLLQTSGERGSGSVLMSAGNILQGNEGPVLIQASESGQMLIQNADGQVVLQDNGALSNVVIVEDKDASAVLHGLVTSADTTGGVATLPAHPSSSLLAQVPLITTPSQQGPIMVSSTRKDEKK